jgi:hypothetical protein
MEVVTKEDFLKEGQELVEKQNALPQEVVDEKNVVDENIDTVPPEKEDEEKTDEEKQVEIEQKRTEAKKTWQELEDARLAQEDLLAAKKVVDEDEFIKGYAKAKALGKQKEYLKVHASIEDIDIEKLSDKDLYLMTLENEDLTQDEKEDSFESFLSLPKSIQNKTIEAKRNELAEGKSKLSQQLSVHNPFAEHAPKAIAEIHSAIDDLVGTEWNGVDVTPQIAANIAKDAKNLLKAYAKADGSFDAATALEVAKMKNMFSLAVSVHGRQQASEAKKEVFKEFVNPDAKTTSGGGNKTLTKMQQATAELEALQQSRITKW